MAENTPVNLRVHVSWAWWTNAGPETWLDRHCDCCDRSFRDSGLLFTRVINLMINVSAYGEFKQRTNKWYCAGCALTWCPNAIDNGH